MNVRLANPISLSVIALACFLAGGAHAADALEELKACARMTEQDARYACYDKLGEQLLDEELQRTPSLPDEIGGAAFEKQSDTPGREDRGLVSSCRKGSNGRWYFYFDNGQIWRESNQGRHRFKDCEFTAVVYQDAFGYKMRIEESGKKIRITRIR